MENQSDFLSLKDLAQDLNVSYWAVWRWVRSGKVRCIRLPSGTLRVPREELERLKITELKQKVVSA